MEPDYYTVMQRKIRYYQMRYDPLNMFGSRNGEGTEKVPETDSKKKVPEDLKKNAVKVTSIFI